MYLPKEQNHSQARQMGLSEHQRKIILKIGSPTPGEELIDQDAVADLMLLGFVFIHPGTGKVALTESGRELYDELLEGGVDR